QEFAMPIPTEPIGSIPRPPALISAMGEFRAGRVTQERMNALYAEALKDTIRRFEETGSPVITDGEKTKPSFATYPVPGAGNIAPDGVVIPLRTAIRASYRGYPRGLLPIRPMQRAISRQRAR